MEGRVEGERREWDLVEWFSNSLLRDLKQVVESDRIPVSMRRPLKSVWIAMAVDSERRRHDAHT